MMRGDTAILKRCGLRVTQDKDVSYIEWDCLWRKLGDERYFALLAWLHGQTTVPRGAYPHDVARFLRGDPILD